MGVGHWITNQDTICYVVAKSHIYNIFVTDNKNTQLDKSNTYTYKKEQNKAIRSKTLSRMVGYIKKMQDHGYTTLQMVPMILMENTMVEECDSNNTRDNESTNDS